MLQEQTKWLIKQLQKKLEGVYHYSDSVFPYTISGIGETNFSLYPILGNSKDGEFNEFTLKDFFSPLLRSHSWLSTEERQRIEKYKSLKEFLTQNFENVKVVKTGSVHIDIHIIAKTSFRDYIIVSTAELKIPVYQKNDA